MGLGSKIRKLRHRIKKEIKRSSEKVLGDKIGRAFGNYANLFIGGTDDMLASGDPLTWSDKTLKYSPSRWKYDATLYGGLAGGLLYGAGALAGGLGSGAGGGAAGTAAGAAGTGTAGGAGAGTMGINWGNALGGALSGLGSIGSSYLSADAARKATERQIAWERERAQNAHQWEVMDLINAGLNPVLSAGGNGAATGGISAPLPDFSGVAQAGTNMFNTMLTAEQTKNAEAERDNINADTQLKGAQVLETMANKSLLNKKEYQTVAETAKTYAQTMLFDQQYKQQAERFEKEIELLAKQIQSAQLQNDEKKIEIAIKEYENAMKKYTWWLNQINQAGRTGSALLLGLSGSAKSVVDIADKAGLIGQIAKIGFI